MNTVLARPGGRSSQLRNSKATAPRPLRPANLAQSAITPSPFNGDAHDFLKWTYQNPTSCQCSSGSGLLRSEPGSALDTLEKQLTGA